MTHDTEDKKNYKVQIFYYNTNPFYMENTLKCLVVFK